MEDFTTAKMPRVRVIFDRKKKATANKVGWVEIEIYYDGRRAVIATGVSLFKDQWKKDYIVGRQDSLLLMQKIEDTKRLITKELDRQLYEDKHIDINSVRQIFTKKKEEEEQKPASPDFLLFMQKRMNERPMAEGTWKQHRSVYHVLNEWGKIKTFADLTPSNIKLWDELSVKNSKTGKPIETYHKVMKIYVREAITFGHISKDNNPYDGFKIKRDRSVKHAFLTQAELNKWCKVKLPSKLAETARDLFVFCCYTGLSYADLSNFDTSLIFEDNGGLRYINSRVKSEEVFHITILRPAKKILDKYNWQLPKMDAHVYNRYLKDIALICGITKTITSHCGRCTFASTVLLANGFGLKTIANAMGHTNTRQTEEYAKLVSFNVDRSFDELNAKL